MWKVDPSRASRVCKYHLLDLDGLNITKVTCKKVLNDMWRRLLLIVWCMGYSRCGNIIISRKKKNVYNIKGWHFLVPLKYILDKNYTINYSGLTNERHTELLLKFNTFLLQHSDVMIKWRHKVTHSRLKNIF